MVLGAEGRPVEHGEDGQLHIAGPLVYQGYWRRPTETATAFIARDGARWYNTDDVVKQQKEEGFIWDAVTA